MKRTEILQESLKMRFEEAYGGWQNGRFSQDEAAKILGEGVCKLDRINRGARGVRVRLIGGHLTGFFCRNP